MPRSASFDREEVLETVATLFRQQGFEGTSMRDVQRATGLAPTSLYAAFGNKERLFEEALTHYQAQLGGIVAAALGDPERGLAAVEAYLQMVVDKACPRYGCLLGKALTDGAADRAEAIVRQAFDQLEELLVQALEVARQAGELPAGHPPRVAARFVMALSFGLQMQARRGLDRSDLAVLKQQGLAALTGADPTSTTSTTKTP